jgi:hypothetical protein
VYWSWLMMPLFSPNSAQMFATSVVMSWPPE